MSEELNLLQKYWKHESFRPLQQEIINAVISNQDTLAILPTGGGKSVCYQIPALIKEGICIVISPLIALIKDQVDDLKSRNIKAIALTGGISQNETSDILDNCLYGNYKFLYISPERLQSDWILERISKLPINFIAIDEAHCISMWGHDFRPAYQKISQIRSVLPKVSMVALTGSATEDVKNDILQQLEFKNFNVFNQSFRRDNLSYMVFSVEDKLYLASQILKKNPQSSIIYVRNRKSCVDISSQIQALGFSSTYYHGGLETKVKEKNMELWMNNKVQVMVATNAFGMGINKPDVKTVMHWQLPESIENYYQEAGRSGRNGDKSYAVILLSPSDILNAKTQFLDVLPDKEFLKHVFVKLCNFLQIAYGEGLDETFVFNINQFCAKYNLPLLKTYNAIQFLDRQGVITLSKEFSEKYSLQIIISSKEIIRYMSLNPNDEEIILVLLRTYPGIYEISTSVNISFIAKKSNVKETVVIELFEKLKQKNIIDFYTKKNDSQVIFNEVREDSHTINRISRFLKAQNQLKENQLNAVIDYVLDESRCKSEIILEYFGEKSTSKCGKCSYCVKHFSSTKSDSNAQSIILKLLEIQNLTSREIQEKSKLSQEIILDELKKLIDQKIINIRDDNSFSINKK